MLTKYKLPISWNWSTLENIAINVVDGPFGSDLKTSDYKPSGLPVLQGKNITNNIFQWFDIRYVSEEKAKSLKRSHAYENDHLLIKIGSIGYSAILDDLQGFPFAIIPANMAKITPDRNKIDDRFLHHWLTGLNAKRHFLEVASKTAQPALSLKKIRQSPIPVPPLAEQKRIAAVLDKAAELRAQRQQALAKLDTLLQSVFLDMFGDPFHNPKGWTIRPLDEICESKGSYGSGASAIDYDETKPRYIRITDINDDGSLNSDLVSPSTDANDWQKNTLQDGDIVFARSGATVGKTYLYRKGDGFCVYAGYLIKFSVDRKIMRPEFLFSYTQTEPYNIWVRSKQKVVAQPNINAKQYGQELLIPVPPLRLQDQFVEVVNAIQSQKAQLADQSDKFDNLFNSLQQRAFQGNL